MGSICIEKVRTIAMDTTCTEAACTGIDQSTSVDNTFILDILREASDHSLAGMSNTFICLILEQYLHIQINLLELNLRLHQLKEKLLYHSKELSNFF